MIPIGGCSGREVAEGTLVKTISNPWGEGGKPPTNIVRLNFPRYNLKLYIIIKDETNKIGLKFWRSYNRTEWGPPKENFYNDGWH